MKKQALAVRHRAEREGKAGRERNFTDAQAMNGERAAECRSGIAILVTADTDRPRYAINCPVCDYFFKLENEKRPEMGRR
ncbi:hypothetical protein [Burkholderia sp. Ac-20344]|uniref:hypothetical protein n=1 Tax=Burkholderia sp. Ac-20344 TaxID=2703890 RepID=UPI00197C5E74|nr:hypothetical protein [Burkholderia sp. Ac-20344]MBN3836632.1 hypothetical protein [Burkholderia sp. Ac-20344]